MRFLPTDVHGVVLIEPEPIEDERGAFMRTFCVDEFAAQGLDPRFVQNSTSVNTHAFTLRGMHFQIGAFEETKLVSCLRGALFDVALDLRPLSPTYLKWAAVELSEENRRALYIPQGCAHGFLTLRDHTEAGYLISARYSAEAARGVRWDDPAFGIAWPQAPRVMSEKDRAWPDFAA